MTIAEAEKRCTELDEEISAIRKDYDFDTLEKFYGEVNVKPLITELKKLIEAIHKAKHEIEIDLPA